MADVKLIPLGLGDIVAKSGTLAAWGYRKELTETEDDGKVPDNIEAIREFLEETSRKHGQKSKSANR